MPNPKKWKRTAPQVLWRLFGDRVRSLAETILFLLPRECRCRFGRRWKCLRCTFHGSGGEGEGEGGGYLVREGDEKEYVEMMKWCYVVVDDNAKGLDPDTCPLTRWSQRQIVCRTIQRILSEQSESSNVLCNGYQMLTDSSPIVNLLSSSLWQKLLQRVGDVFMCYLLTHTMIFLFRGNNKHQQVAGQPVSCSYAYSPWHLSENHHQSFKSKGERRRVGKYGCCTEDLPSDKTRRLDDPIASAELVPPNATICEETSTSNQCKQKSQLTLSAAAIKCIGLLQRQEKLQSDTEMNGNMGKRLRSSCWLSRKRPKLSTLQELNASNSLATPDVDRTAPRYHHSSVFPHQMSQRNQVCFVGQHRETKPVPATELNSAHHMIERCACCLTFQTSAILSKDTQINRKRMLYNMDCQRSLFPKKHVLNSLKPGTSGATFLVKDIMGISDVKDIVQTKCIHYGSSCVYHSLIKMLIKLMRRAQRCQYNRLLDKHCPLRPLLCDANKDFVALPEDNQTTTTTLHVIGDVWSAAYDSRSENGMKIEESIDVHKFLNKSYCSNHEVVSFIWAVCRNIVPPPLLGSTSTWRILRRNIYRFIELRQFEKFYLNQCLNGLKPSRFPLLSDMYSFCCISGHIDNDIIQPASELQKCVDFNIWTLKQNLFERWIFWFFSCIVVPLVEANFYVTESQHGKQSLFYYRKTVWKDLISKACTGEKDETYRTLDNKSVKDILEKRPFGFSKVRVCPKSSGARVIANLKASSRIPHGGSKSFPKARKVSRMKSVNCILRDLLVVLKDFRKIEPEKWGSSVFDYNDIYKKLQPFFLNLKKDSNIPDVFIVSADVHKAFDTINQDKLLAVINETLTKDEYVLQRTNEISWSKKSLLAYKNQNLVGPRVHDVGVADARPSHPLRSRHAIIVSEERGRTIRKEELQLLLTEHVKRNVLRINKSFLLQLVGIPQGSTLSSNLCSLYLGHLERNVLFPFLDEVCASVMLEQAHTITMSQPKNSTGAAFSSPKWTLLRLIDDFLFISTSKELSTSFFSRMRWGFQEYNCYMNEHKFCYSFGVCLKQDALPGSKGLDIDGISYIQWSGLLINSITLEVQADYTRYLNNHLRSTLSVCWRGKPGHHLKSKLCDYMRPKCHPLFYDPNLNSPAIIRLNIYQAFLLCAMKFHSYVCQLSKVCKLRPRFYLLIIESSLRYTKMIMKKRMRQLNPDCARTLFAHIDKKEIHWLGLTAYVRSLTKKQSRHKALLRLLRSKLAALGDLGTSPEIHYAVDHSHSKWLWKIKY
ncbi:hypothetical protein Drorol1_Dr00027959 [Drosera rotundifolia]